MGGESYGLLKDSLHSSVSSGLERIRIKFRINFSFMNPKLDQYMNNKYIKVLLIEDNPSDTLLIRKMLENPKVSSFQLESTDSLSKGLKYLSENDIDAILLDLSLPDSSGIDTYERVRIHAPHIPVVVLTGNNDEELAGNTLRNGAQDYLIKGRINADLVKRSLRYSIERKRSEEILQKAYNELEQRVEDRTDELKKIIAELNLEIKKRKEAEESLQSAHNELEACIKKRTQELQEANDSLNLQLEEHAMISEALQEGEQQFRALIANIHGAVYRFRIDSEQTMEFISDVIEEISGYPPSHFVQNRVRPYRSIIHPGDIEKVEKAIQEGMAPMKSFRVKYRIIHANGEIRWFVETGKVVYSADGEPLWLDGSIFDESNRKHAEDELQKANQRLQHLASIDGLTQIANRRQFDSCMDKEWKRLLRSQNPLSVILCDIDFFKLYNDNYGHQAGDECLYTVAQAISSVTKRSSDLAARYGGEEFVVILPDTDSKGCISLAEEIRNTIRQLKIPHAHSSIDQYITLSFGVSSTIPNREFLPKALIGAADLALYKAKKEGRNRICSNNTPGNMEK